MKFIFVMTLIVLFIAGCVSNEYDKSDLKSRTTDSISAPDILVNDTSIYPFIITHDTTRSYSEIKNEIKVIKSGIDTSKISEDSLSQLFINLLVERIFPYWYGTKWSFEGHTSNPNNGEIACGYFVSTTLRDAGFNINKYKLAQQSPINEAKSINIDNPVIEIYNESVEENIIELQKLLKEGIYFIGFDQNHVGFIFKKADELFLIHSNYADFNGVMTERIHNSLVFPYYNRFYIAEISTNKSLLKKWLLNEEI
ncbi:MAG: hypothetical protein ABIJ97_02095, partial [Bacteroidota bacterium]